jgi:deoxyribodipyrimidine photo-lyase
MVHPARIHSAGPPPAPAAGGTHVLYWMQQSQRAEFNHALEYAVERANALRLPVVAAFALAPFPEATRRPYQFMLEGLRETRDRLAQRGIGLCVRQGPPEDVVPDLARHAALLVGDVGYLRVQRAWREAVARRVDCPFVLVESDAVVPVQAASDHAEYAARTLRPKIHRLLTEFLRPIEPLPVAVPSLDLVERTLPLDDPPALCRSLGLDESVPPSGVFLGGRSRAVARLDAFLRHRLALYADEANDPSLGGCSGMSPYLHFGQISSLEIALRVQAADVPRAAADAYLEQLLVRRELSLNAIWHRPGYDRYDALPAWAQSTLAQHAADPRQPLYSRDAWQAAATHDPCWNAAQNEMLRTGHMHNYMRMYWGKKILEWSRTPQEAFDTALYLNNRYQLDGRDPNGFVGVAWCFGLHDRPWTRRPVFGTVRYMNANGLRRKFDVQTYVDRWLPNA